MSGSIKILFVFGTRPEAIKLAPLILKMKKDGRFLPRVCVTAQHRDMLDQVIGLFRIKPDYDLDIMMESQSLFDIAARSLASLERVLRKETPDMVVVQGDTTSTFAGSLAAFYMQIPVGHVEAGLRTDDKYRPFPEEINRRLTSHIADLHFAPTKRARDNLLEEGIPGDGITVTGNTAVDALLFVKAGIQTSKTKQKRLRKAFPFLDEDKPVVLVTAHRRESFGEGLRNICEALKEIALNNNVKVVYPVHLNPNVKKPVTDILKAAKNVHLIGPQEYEPFVYLMMNAYLILTDSGGIQEEAPTLGKPVLVMRTVTERPEAVKAGAARLVGTEKHTIVGTVERLLHDKRAYREMTGHNNPYGDGRASERIIKAILKMHR